MIPHRAVMNYTPLADTPTCGNCHRPGREAARTLPKTWRLRNAGNRIETQKSQG
jgi:hypothetical protein